MPAEQDRSSWLLEPPGAGEVKVSVELGEGAELTPAAQQALEDLMRELDQAEVEGYAMRTGGLRMGLFGGGLEGHCSVLSCGQHTCSAVHTCGTYTSLL